MNYSLHFSYFKEVSKETHLYAFLVLHNNPTQVFVGANSDFLMKQNHVTGYDPWASIQAWEIIPSSAWMLLTYSFYVPGSRVRFLCKLTSVEHTWSQMVMNGECEYLEGVSMALFCFVLLHTTAEKNPSFYNIDITQCCVLCCTLIVHWGTTLSFVTVANLILVFEVMKWTDRCNLLMTISRY